MIATKLQLVEGQQLIIVRGVHPFKIHLQGMTEAEANENGRASKDACPFCISG